MDTLRLKPRLPVEDDVENWDDDDFMIEDDVTFGSVSTNAQLPGSRRESHSSFRSDLESIHAEEEQHVLLPGEDEKSTLDAIALAANAGIPLPKNVPPSALMGGTIKRLGGRKIKKIFQEDWGDDLELPDDRQPLHIKPQDGSQFPDVLRQVSGSSQASSLQAGFSEGPIAGPASSSPAPAPALALGSRATGSASTPINLDRFRDSEDDDDFFGDGAATIKVPKTRQAPKPISLITPPTPQKQQPQQQPQQAKDDDFENDLELPSDGNLTLSKRKEIPKTPSLNAADDFEWGEGSLGTRFGGTRRDVRSNRSSSVSAMSPSVSSSITAESEGEDDTFDGLVLPAGPVNFGEMLQKRRQSRSPNRGAERAASPQKQPKPPPLQTPTHAFPTQAHQPHPQTHTQPLQSHTQPPQSQPPQSQPPQQTQQLPTPVQTPTGLGIQPHRQSLVYQQQPEADKEDVLSGLDLGDGEVFDASRLTLHRNVRIKETRPASPSRPKAAVSISFTNKPSSGVSRLPRPMGSHERTHTTSSLEPVSESGGPITGGSLARRSQSRLSHSAQSSVSSIPTPTTPSSIQSLPPSTPRRREVGSKLSNSNLRGEPTTTNAQLLRLKRSLPAMRTAPSPAPRTGPRAFERPSSRTDNNSSNNNNGSGSGSRQRPKTPVERVRPSIESAAAQARKNPVPFLPAGASQSQSHHVTAKNSRVFRRHDSDTSVDARPMSRSVSRSKMRSPSPAKRYRHNIGQSDSWQQLNKPRRQRNFGDGHELDGFDDLPTSAQAEAPFLRQPISASQKQLRHKTYQSILPDRISAPSPSPYSPAKFDTLPHFARDTTASRIARETSLAQRAPSGPLAPLTTQRVAQLSLRSNNNFNTPHPPRDTVRSKKTLRRPPQLKPHLISNLGGAKEPKSVNGMMYNPVTMRWEGNENALSAFDPPASSPSTASVAAQHMHREKESSTPRPALITPIGATKGVQVVGGMVFDPQNMCWLKLGPQHPNKTGDNNNNTDDTMDGFNGIDSDEDVFKDIPDLDDTVDSTDRDGGSGSGGGGGGGGNGGGSGAGGGGARTSEIKDDWLVGEEFDVGPEFIRRQREEEQRWRKKCEKWMSAQERDNSTWKWLLREMVTHPL